MPTLSSSNSLFELAFGVNAVLPMLIDEFTVVREQAAESILRKINEYRPDFKLKERQRLRFVEFTFKSSPGLRHSKMVTYITGLISVVLCALSLSALYWSALDPNREYSSKLLFVFVGLTLVFGPLFYVVRNYYLKWLYITLVTYSTNEKREALFFADCVDTYLRHEERWEPLKNKLDEMMAEIPLDIWKMRLMIAKMRFTELWYWIRSKLPFKPTR
jgi:hypothetical protein